MGRLRVLQARGAGILTVSAVFAFVLAICLGMI
jgi:hypothetical protein